MENYLQTSSAPDISLGVNLSYAYESGLYKGWNKDLAAEAFSIVGSEGSKINHSVGSLPVKGNGKMFLWQFTRKLLGKDTLNYPQEIGDCTSFGAKNATEYLQCVEKVMKGDRELFRPIFPPYYYGCERVYVGNNQLGSEDGGVGAWMAKAVTVYGALASDEDGVPKYAGNVAKAYGAASGRQYLEKWKPIGQKHLVKSAAPVTSWEDTVKSITNGYPVVVCSNQGFSMSPDSNGFHRAQGTWGHCMCVIGVDDDYSRPYVIILNSWGDVMGRLSSFYDPNEKIPVGCLRVDKNVFVNNMLSENDTFAYSNFDGFPEQELDEALFKIVGN